MPHSHPKQNKFFEIHQKFKKNTRAALDKDPNVLRSSTNGTIDGTEYHQPSDTSHRGQLTYAMHMVSTIYDDLQQFTPVEGE